MPTLVVTGARGRLGRVVAAKFAESDFDVVGIDSSGDGNGPNICYQADLTSEDSVHRVFDTIRSKHGEIRGLVHAVGAWDGHPTVHLSLERWTSIIDVNLTSTFLVFREALRHAEAGDQAGVMRLIAFTSGQGADRGVAEQAAYAAAKAGIVRLVESVAAEYPKRNVTAHAIAPSVILFDGMEEQDGISVHDIANLCTVLMGDAGGMMSGTTVRAYGTLG